VLTLVFLRPDYDESFNQDFDALKKAVPGNEDVIHAITVGSECLYRGDITAQKLLRRINQVKDEFPSITVGTVDSWNKFADGTADPIVQGGVTYLSVVDREFNLFLWTC
jgi:glucan 1,3-beta-glucosidase